MASGLTVEPQALRGTGDGLKGYADQAGGMVSKAASAVVHPKSWGLVGVVTLYAQYASTLPALHEHLNALQTTLGVCGDKLKDAATAYEDADRSLGEALDKIAPPAAAPRVDL